MIKKSYGIYYVLMTAIVFSIGLTSLNDSTTQHITASYQPSAKKQVVKTDNILIDKTDLPVMYVDDPIAFLQNFPLGVLSTADITLTYGQPRMAIDGARKNREIWTYYQGSDRYVYYFVDGRVNDVTIAYTGPVRPVNLGLLRATYVQSTIAEKEYSQVHTTWPLAR